MTAPEQRDTCPACLYPMSEHGPSSVDDAGCPRTARPPSCEQRDPAVEVIVGQAAPRCRACDSDSEASIVAWCVGRCVERRADIRRAVEATMKLAEQRLADARAEGYRAGFQSGQVGGLTDTGVARAKAEGARDMLKAVLTSLRARANYNASRDESVWFVHAVALRAAATRLERELGARGKSGPRPGLEGDDSRPTCGICGGPRCDCP